MKLNNIFLLYLTYLVNTSNLFVTNAYSMISGNKVRHDLILIKPSDITEVLIANSTKLLVRDIKNKILRSPNIIFFKQYPLGFYRVMQFISRFKMYPDIELNNACKSIDISKVSKKNIEQEFKKLFLKSEMPSLGIRWLQDINRLKEILPELYDNVCTNRTSKNHPEGSIFEHLLQSLDSSALLKYKNTEEKLIVMMASLCHDLGKISTSIFKNGRIRSPGHALAGVIPTKYMLSRITSDKRLIRAAAALVKWHMTPKAFIKSSADLSAYKKLALDLSIDSDGYANIDMLVKVAIADKQARNPNSHVPLKKRIPWIDEFKEKAKEAGVLKIKKIFAILK